MTEIQLETPPTTHEEALVSDDDVSDTLDSGSVHEDQGDQSPQPNGESSVEDNQAEEAPVQTPLTVEVEAPSSKPPVTGRTTSQAKKPTMSSVKPAGGPPTPTVKKIINSGTFGAGSVKPTVTRPASSTTAKPTAPVLKKPTTSTPAPTSKPTMSSSTSKPVVSSTPASRRASVVPAKPSSATSARTPLSASTSNKPSATEQPARSSVASPTGSVASAAGVSATSASRPRASVSEALRKPPASSRPSVATSKTAAPSKVTPVSRSSAAPAPRTTRPSSSISSIKEIQESAKSSDKVNEKALAELQTKVDEATKALEEKTTTVSELQSQVERLEASLSSTTSQLEAAESSGELQETQSKLSEAQASLNQVMNELDGVKSSLESAQRELEETKARAESRAQEIESLTAQITNLSSELASSKDANQDLQRAHADILVQAEAASGIQKDLESAEAKVSALTEEIVQLKASRDIAQKGFDADIAELQAKAAEAESLNGQVAALKEDKDDAANRISELEVEILELKEAQDQLDDEKFALTKEITNLKAELAKSDAKTAEAIDEANKKVAAHEVALQELAAKHDSDLAAEKGLYEEAVASLTTLKAQYSEALANLEQAKADLAQTAEVNATNVATIQASHQSEISSLSEKLAQVSKELEDQETIYSARVDDVKAEHEVRLKEAFEKAKQEEAEKHSLELQALRSESNATIAQIQAANQNALDSLRVDHASTLEDDNLSLNKLVSNLKLELKATQDDLSKAKSALETSSAEIVTLTKQRDMAQSLLDAAPTISPAQALEVERIQRELAATKDDLKAMDEALNLTQSSMAELSDKHMHDMEAAAQSRAAEVLALRSVHDEEVATLATQKSELLIQLSDLQGELATVKASASAQPATPAKSNGNGVASSPGVTKEELAKMHEAHNLKIYDLEAAHEKSLKHLQEQLEQARNMIEDLNQDVARKAMEIQYLEQEQDESTDQITRLKEDVDTLTEKLAARGA